MGTNVCSTGICKCDWKQWLLASLVVAVVYCGLDFLVHHKLLMALYSANAHLWRTQEAASLKMCWLWINYLVVGLLFTCIYSKGYDAAKAGPSQGLRYGFLIGVFYWGTHLLGSYPFHPWPDRLYQSWFACGLAEFTILGILVGLIYRPKA